MPAVLRILTDPPLDGSANMARDEALMEAVGRGESPLTLRLYQWSPPTISLGYFQPYADFEALEPPARDLAVVRRPTGGGAILHDQELTYSLTLPLDHLLLSRGPNHLYELAHDAVIAALDEHSIQARRGGFTDDSGPRHGPFFCFARRHCYDVLIADHQNPLTPVGGHKIAGSAQRRTRRAVLQHGSIVLAIRYAQQPAARLPTVLDARAFVPAFAARLAELAGLEPIRSDWSPAELESAGRIIAKYAGDEWLRRA
jgi:lipoate-protein ligase A